MAFIDVFTVETEHRSIYGVPSKDDKSTKVFILEYLLIRVPDDTLEESRLIYQYGKYNIGDEITEQSGSGGVGQPVPSPTPFVYLKLDGSNTMDSGYTPTNALSVVTLKYFQDNGTGLLLGNTHDKAYYGDFGAAAYAHSIVAHAPAGAEVNRTISDSLSLTSSVTSASSTAVKLLNDNKSSTTHEHDADYEPINSNIQTHIANTSLHIQYFKDLLDTSPYSGNQGKIAKVNATEDGIIWGDPSGSTVSWGDISGTLGVQTDLLAALDAKVDDTQVLTNVPSGALFTDVNYSKDAQVVTHLADVSSNPHEVSQTNVGLGNIDNTSDVNKPISTATQTALDLKEASLGNPTVAHDVLSSLTNGTRSWKNPLELVEEPANTTISGISVNITAGETMYFGNLLYVKSDGKAWLADGDSTNAFPVFAMCSETITANNEGKILLFGIATNTSWTLTIGTEIYLSDSPGTITQIKPSAVGTIVQVVGIALDTDRLLFNPSMVDSVVEAADITPPATITLTTVEGI